VNDLIPFVTLAVLAVAAWTAGLMLLDVFTPEDVRAWKRMSALRGYVSPRSAIERFAGRTRLVQRLQSELELQRLLALSERRDTPFSFLTRSLALALGVFAAVLTLDAAGRAASGDWPLSPWVALLAGSAVLPFRLISLRQHADRRRTRAEQALGDMLMMAAVMTDARGFQLNDAVRILSRCTVGTELQTLIDRGGWRRLVHENARSTVELYQLIGSKYRIPMFTRLADAAATANVGFPERDAYARLAISFYRDNLADARVRAARAKVLVTLPVAGMLIPLLLLIGAPTFQAVTQGLQGG
jgi:hypothetical protein